MKITLQYYNLLNIILTRQWEIYVNGVDFFSAILRFASCTNDSAVVDKPFATKC